MRYLVYYVETQGRSVTTDTGLALIGKNKRGTQALKQNIAGRLIFVVDRMDDVH